MKGKLARKLRKESEARTEGKSDFIKRIHYVELKKVYKEFKK